jgi:hypothetical protein
MSLAAPPKVVFSAIEAAVYLGLTLDGRDEESALRSLKRLVDDKKVLRAMRFCKFRTFHIRDLDDFLERQRNGASDT